MVTEGTRGATGAEPRGITRAGSCWGTQPPAPTLAVGIRFTGAALGPAAPAGAQVADIVDLTDALTLAALPTAAPARRSRSPPTNRVVVQLPRAEVGQGITTAMAQIVAEELDARLADVDVVLDDARPELLFNQLTGGSNTRARRCTGRCARSPAGARARLVTAAAQRWGVPASAPVDRATPRSSAPDGRTATYGELSAAAAAVTVPAVAATPKDPADFTVVGQPTTRIDARDIVTGRAQYTLDLDVPGALPSVVARPPDARRHGAHRSTTPRPGPCPASSPSPASPPASPSSPRRSTRRSPAATPCGRAGTRARAPHLSDAQVSRSSPAATAVRRCRRSAPRTVDAHVRLRLRAPRPAGGAQLRRRRAGRPGRAVAGVQEPDRRRPDRGRWRCGLPAEPVTLHVVRGGGSFGRRLFFDPAIEAARVSKASAGRSGCCGPATTTCATAACARRATTGAGHPPARRGARLRAPPGLGADRRPPRPRRALTAGGRPGRSACGRQPCSTSASIAVRLRRRRPSRCARSPSPIPTASWRSVYSGRSARSTRSWSTSWPGRWAATPSPSAGRGCARPALRAVLDRWSSAGPWGRAMPAGTAQGVGLHEEYKCVVACLVEIDAATGRRPGSPRRVAAVDVGLAVNPRGLEAQLQGALIDALSMTLQAGNHLDDGAMREGSYADFRWARMADSPSRSRCTSCRPPASPAAPASSASRPPAAAVANAYARATGAGPPASRSCREEARRMPTCPTASTSTARP